MAITSDAPIAVSKSGLALALACGALPGLFLLITSTTHLVDGEFVYDVKRLLQLCLMLLLFLAAAVNAELRNAFAVQFGRIPTWVKALLGLIIVLGIISSAVNASSGMHLAYSLLEVALLSMLVLAALVIAACRVVAGEIFDQVAITLLAMTAIAVGIQELLGVTAALANDLEFFFRISLMHFSYPRFYNQVQAWTLPLLAALPLVWSRSRSELLRSTWFQAFVCLSALALHWYIILMTGGRGVALSLLASFVICLLVFPATRRPTLRWHLPGLLLGALLFFAVAQLIESSRAANPDQAAAAAPAAARQSESVNPDDHFAKPADQTRFEDQSIAGRLSLDGSGRIGWWRNATRDIRSRPLLGIGPMNFACTGPVYRAAHPHNFALQVGGEWGLPATLALLGVVVFIILELFSGLRSAVTFGNKRIVIGMVTMGLASAAAYSMLSGVLVMPASHVTGILIGGWLMGLMPLRNPVQEPGRGLAASVLAAGLMVAVSVTLFSFVESGKRVYRESMIPPLDAGIPRFWQQGKLCKYFDRYAEADQE